jgi:hypothetical protein
VHNKNGGRGDRCSVPSPSNISVPPNPPVQINISNPLLTKEESESFHTSQGHHHHQLNLKGFRCSFHERTPNSDELEVGYLTVISPVMADLL